MEPAAAGIRKVKQMLDAGFDTLEEIAACAFHGIQRKTTEFVKRTEFDSIPPLPAEISYSIDQARRLPKVVVL